MRTFLATLVAAVTLLSTASLAAANQTGADWVSSDNVEYLGSIKQDVGLTTGATPLGGSSSSPKWAPTGDVVYSLDYDRGIDIIRWKGQHYVPTANGRRLKREPGRVRGTNGRSALPALTASQAASRTRLSGLLQPPGWSPWICQKAALGV
jgi:hypothetical protein